MLNDYWFLITLLEHSIKLPDFSLSTWMEVMVLVFFGVLLLFEHYVPRETLAKKDLAQSYKNNLGLFVFNNVLMSVLSITSLFLLAKYYAGHGLFKYIANPVLKGLLSLLVLDLFLYGWHRICHRFDSLWMFHKIHHSDVCLNVTTAFRLHFLEVALTNLLKAVFIIALGIEERMVLTSELITTVCIMFHHANITFKGERWVGRLLIVPYLHRAHHSLERTEHDSNYGAILSLWDTCFNTRTEVDPIALGVKSYMPEDVLSLVKAGFILAPMNPPAIIQPSVLEHMIAEAAYYKAEKRGFYPGHEMQDWLDAKKEVLMVIYGNRSNPTHFVARCTKYLRKYNTGIPLSLAKQL